MKKEKGITLIALIITIIVMLILVVVTINIVTTGEIINKTTEAKTQTQAATQNELNQMNSVAKGISDAVGNNNSSTAIPILTIADLRNIANNPSATYQLQNDIDISGETWDAIPMFTGILDGNNKKITIGELNATAVQVEEDYSLPIAGLIGFSTGEIKNLQIVGNITITNTNNLTVEDQFLVGLIVAGNMGGTIHDCYNTGNIIVNMPMNINLGAITASNEGTVKNCYNTGTISATSSEGSCAIAGISSENGAGIVENCYNIGDITANGLNNVSSSGITSSNNFIIQNCYNTGTIIANQTGSDTYYTTYAGGIVANSYDDTDIITQNCYNIGNVSGTGSGYVAIGSIIGRDKAYEGTTKQRNYYLIGTATNGIGANTDDSNKVQSMASNDMKQSNLITPLNTGFTDLPWKEDIGNINNGYPILSWQ